MKLPPSLVLPRPTAHNCIALFTRTVYLPGWGWGVRPSHSAVSSLTWRPCLSFLYPQQHVPERQHSSIPGTVFVTGFYNSIPCPGRNAFLLFISPPFGLFVLLLVLSLFWVIFFLFVWVPQLSISPTLSLAIFIFITCWNDSILDVLS